MGKPPKGSVVLLAGTRKGMFVLRSDARRKSWSVDGPHFLGLNVHHAILDPRDSETIFAATFTDWWGSDIQRSHNWGRTWQRTKGGVRYDKSAGLNVKCIWSICPGRASEPGVVYAGVDPAGLFRSDDGGVSWHEVKPLNRHATRKKWQPGAGGLILHTIALDPVNRNRMYIAISAAGFFRTDDGGRTWQPRNRNTRADFMPNKFPAVGQCVHRFAVAAGGFDRVYQQNHCGVYRSDTAGDRWMDISRGLSSRFGFPIVAHPRDAKQAWVVPLISDQYRTCPEGRPAVWHTRDAGRTWTKRTRGLPARHAHLTILRSAMSVDSCDPVGVYFGTETGQVFHSRDEGRGWHLLADFLPPVYSLEAAVI